MKLLSNYIAEYLAHDINDELMLDRDKRIVSSEISEDDLKHAGWGGSFMDDRSWIVVDNIEYTKIKADGWQANSSLSHALSGIISSAELYKRIQKVLPVDGFKGEIYKEEGKNASL